MKEITPSMKDTRSVIQNNEVTYRYRPVRRSVNRPLPVTGRELSPVYSHGLHARSVQALIDRGLVKLSPIDQESGRVIEVPADQD